MSGQWPPEWEDSDTGLPDEWNIDDAELDPEASAVTLFLASVPSPVLPASFEARISAAIAAEATARANGTAPAGTESAGTQSGDSGIATPETDDAETTDRSSPPEFSPAAAESGSASAAKHRRRRTSAASRSAAARSRPAGSRPGGRRRRFRMPSPAVSASLVIILFVVGFAVVASQGGPSSSSSYAGPDTSGTSAQAGRPATASGHSSTKAGRDATAGPAGPQYETNTFGLAARFVVTESGTRYQGSTLTRQVREQLGAVTPSAVTPAPSAPNSASASPAASASASAASSSSASSPPTRAPSANLAGCVSHLTRGVTPSLVDQASYDGIPAYIIAVPSHVWVVRLGCTAADPQEITSVSLTGLFRESQRPRIG
jgi:hypothetical protein